MNSEKPMARRYIEAALESIDRNRSLDGADLRKVSRSLGCAHTNLYNYFGSLDDLLWRALVEAVERLMEHTRQAMAGAAGREEAFRVFIGSQVDFARAHPGWYRFIWMDPLKGEPAAELVPRLARPGVEFARYLAGFAPRSLPPEAAARAADIIHGYLHGALSRMVAGRYVEGEPAHFRETLIANAQLVFEMLCAARKQSSRRKGRQ
jgi:AcrR family transcriptional regulator